MIDLLYPAKPAPVVPAPRSYMVDENLVGKEEMLPVVEPSGVVTGQMARSYAHKGTFLLHPVVHLHIIDRQGRIYLQKRSASKELFPGRWDTAVGGHIGYGESISEALAREAQEELNFTDFNPVFIDSYELIMLIFHGLNLQRYTFFPKQEEKSILFSEKCKRVKKNLCISKICRNFARHFSKQKTALQSNNQEVKQIKIVQSWVSMPTKS